MLYNKIAIIFLLATVVVHVKAECNICSSISGAACVSENSFRICFDATATVPDATSPTISCPSGTKCVDTAEICSSTVQSSCTSACGKCSFDYRFACMTQTSFALCLGNQIPSTTIARCPTGTVCDINAPNFCVVPTVTETGSCTQGQVATTNVSPTTTTQSPTNFCNNNGQPKLGRWPILGTNCKSYIYCYASGGVILGQKYNCPGVTLFNPTLQQCTFYACTES